MPSTVFISYRRDDAKWQAREIYRALTHVLPREQVFMDVDSIPPGADFVQVLEGWVEQCDVVLALIGVGWLDVVNPNTGRPRLEDPNDFVRIELRNGLARGIPVVPVLLDGAPMPETARLPDDLKGLVRRNAEFIEHRTADSDVDRLIRKLGLTAAPHRPAVRGPLRKIEERDGVEILRGADGSLYVDGQLCRSIGGARAYALHISKQRKLIK